MAPEASRSFAPTGYSIQLQSQPPIPTVEQQQPYSPVQYYSVPNSPVTSYQDPTELNRNRRHDSNNDKEEEDGGRRLLSNSQINRITETLGALNTVGRYLVNMTRADSDTAVQQEEEGEDEVDEDEDEDEDDEDDSDEGSFFDFVSGDDDDDEDEEDQEKERRKRKKKSKPQVKPKVTTTTTERAILEQRNDNIPEAILTLTSNVLGKNLTKTIEPLIKRVTMGGEVDQKEAVVEAEVKKRLKTKTNKTNKRKREDIKDRIDSPPTPTASLFGNIPSVVPTPTGKRMI